MTPELPCQGRTLHIRATQLADAPVIYDRGYSRREFMRLFRLNDTPTSAEEIAHRWRQRQQVPPQNRRYLEWLVVHHRHGAIGLCALADVNSLHRRAELLIGLFDLDQRYAGCGIEATLLILDVVFNGYNLNKLYADTYGYNPFTPQTGMTSFGFQLEGCRREQVFDRVAKQFVDLYDYGLLQRDFRASDRLARLSTRLLGRDITQPPREFAPHYGITPSGQRLL